MNALCPLHLEPQIIAADLLAQAEHDTDALPVLVTTHEPLVAAVELELARQLDALPTKAVAAVSVSKVCDSLLNSSAAVHERPL